MGENELNFEKSNTVESAYERAKSEIREGRFANALDEIETVMRTHFREPGLYENDMRALMFWLNRAPTLREIEGDYEYGTTLVSWYDKYEAFIEANEDAPCALHQAIREFVFVEVIRSLSRAYEESGERTTLTLLGRALVEFDEYQRAIDTFTYLLESMRYDSYSLAYLAEAHLLSGNMRVGKAFLREALFYDPIEVVWKRMRNDIVRTLIQHAHEDGLTEIDEIALWLGVYGEIYGICDVKKALSEQDVITLRKNIARFEAEYKKEEKRRHIEPRLILSYLWLISYLALSDKHEHANELQRVYDKLQRLNDSVYRTYTKTIHNEGD